MPAIDNPNSFDATLPGQLAILRKQVKDLSVNSVYSPSLWHVGTGGLIVDGTTVLTGATTLTGGVAGPVAATGAVSGSSVSSSGNVSATGQVISTGVIQSPGSRANTLGTWVALQIDPSGNLGLAPSTVRVKQDFRPVELSDEVKALLTVALVEFRYIEHVDILGDDTPYHLSGIAEYFEAIGLGRYIYRDADGKVGGIQIDRLVLPLIATVQELHSQLKADRSRLDGLEARLKAAGL